MIIPTDEKVKEYLDSFITIFWTDHSKDLVTKAITDYTEWLREREGVMKDKFNKFVQSQENIPQEFVDIVNKEFWNLVLGDKQ